MTKKNRICLGAVAGVHGIKGEVKVKSFTEVDSDLDKYGLVENEAGDRRFELKVVGHSKELLRLRIFFLSTCVGLRYGLLVYSQNFSRLDP